MNDPQHDLRERLRALGYLNAPVDRFVLAGAADRRSAARLALSTSLRIGLLTGLLLGPAAAIGLASKLPELITGVTDAVMVAAYLGALFGLSAAAAALAVTLLAVTLTRGAASSAAFPARARAMSAGAGVLIGVASLIYLTLWWRAAVTASSAPTLASSLAVLAVAVSISLVMGHAVTVAALAIAARLNASTALGPGVPFSSWRATAPLAAAAFAGAAALLFATASSGNRPQPSPSLTVVPTGQRVLVIGIDGVDADLVERLRRSGGLPALGRLLDGATAALPGDADRDPARVWTTIATGQPPDRHGISALESRQLAGVSGRLQPTSRFGALIAGATDLVRLTRPTIASGTERKIPAFWEVAARSGLRTSAINWWATWPAGEGGEDTGTVLTDRALLRLEQGGALDAEIAPASLYADLERSWPARRARSASRASAAADGAPPDVAAVIQRSAELDAAVTDLAVDPAMSNVDLEVVYLPGLDIAQHGLLASASGASAPSALAARVKAIEHYYQFLDGLIGALADPIRTVVLIAQPGRVSAPGSGLLAIAGVPAAAGAHITAPLTSIAGTVLYLLGVPVASDLASPVATALFAQDFLRAHPEREVSTYGPRRVGARDTTGKPLDREMIDRMRSLGYVR